MARCFRLSLVLIFLSLTFAAAAQEQPVRLPLAVKDIEAALDLDWYGVYFQGKKIGYVHASRTREGKGDAVFFRETFRMAMKLVSFGQKAEITASQVLDFDGKAPFALRGANGAEADGKNKQLFKLTRQEKGFALAHTTGKVTRTRQVGPLDYTLADAMTAEMWLKAGRKVGDRILTKGFDLKDLELPLSSHKILAQKTSLVGGVKVEYFEVDTFLHKEKISVLARYDRAGRMLSGNLAIFELRRETEEQAKNTEYSQDVFVLGQVKAKKPWLLGERPWPLGNPGKIKSLVLEVKGADKATLPSGPRQLVTVNDDGTLTLKLGKAHRQNIKATPQEIEENLKETRAYPITDAKIKALAAKAVGDAATPEEKVNKLVHFVHDFIQPSLTVHLPNIPDLLEHQKGDCKSYALLFTTLARAAGLPARELSGLAYMGDDTKAFGGHAWNEVVLGGLWVPIDAAFDQVEIDAGHVSFGSQQEAIGNLLKNLGKISFRLVEVQK